ncbi:AarF/ABC1/UbiB kinase family protein [Tepidiforma sp.]|uniref:ABC1 kinase family protein n=1 Tax=Tepidiforma sp. TaxID=2682230 RepID=UPI002ADD3E4E|nr:AarF/ABC1/UbiB kinase family protein [Tepidiforma sp.]
MFETVSRLRRSARVARTAGRMYFGYKRTQREAAKLPPAEAAAAWEVRHEQFAEALYRLATDLRGLYIKSGQFLGTRTDLLPAAYTRSLSRLQDAVPPHPFGVVRQTVEEQFGAALEDLFASFEEVPIAAASLAQVHRARLPDGRDVVVKVQYPEVEGLVRLDVRNLRTLVGLVARLERNFDYRAVVNEIAKQVPLELDFEREAEMTRRVRANLAHLPGVVVPAVVDGYVRPKVLVTEYVEGARLLDAEQRDAHAPDRAALAGAITSAYGHQIMVDGLFQADPHPGNILVLPGGRVALLDFGLTKELPEAARRGFARLVLGTANRDPEAIRAAFRELGVRLRNEEPEALLATLAILFEPRPIDGGQGELRERNRVMRANPVEQIPGDLVLLGRVIGLLRGVCASLGAPLSPMQMLRPFAERALSR